MIDTWSRGNAAAFLPDDAFVRMTEHVRRHPWWRARSRLVRSILRTLGVKPPASVVDVGCGWGVDVLALERAGYAVVGLDASRGMLELLDRPGRTLIEADLTQPAPEAAPTFDALLALDVIEHLDDDRAAMAWSAARVKPGGVAVVSVPALPRLFSHFDTIQGHRRRYEPATLRRAFEGSGLEVETVIWWGAWMVPVLARQRVRKTPPRQAAERTYADYLRLPPWPVPSLMTLMFAGEHHLALARRLSTGTSLFAIARKPAGSPRAR
jgi:SAM-dependent methyltransferase